MLQLPGGAAPPPQVPFGSGLQPVRHSCGGVVSHQVGLVWLGGGNGFGGSGGMSEAQMRQVARAMTSKGATSGAGAGGLGEGVHLGSAPGVDKDDAEFEEQDELDGGVTVE